MLLRALVLLAVAAAPLAAQADDHLTTLTAPDGTTAEIVRDEFGVPHIYATTETGAFYAQGFAVAQDRLFQMETFWRVATGRMAEIMGPDALGTDQAIRTVFYTPAERADQFDALPAEVRSMLDAYIAGINAYIDRTEADPDTYLPFEYTQFPLNLGPIERWDRDKAVAVLQFFMRRFGEIGGDELARLGELQAQGPEWFEANRPINDPAAYTSIQSDGPPLLARGTDAGASSSIRVSPEVIREVQERRASVDADLEAWGVPLRFGSFAALVRPEVSSTGTAMLLGAPQMGRPSVDQKAITSEVEILVTGGIHIAGMTVPGIPGVIIGRVGTQGGQRAWTLTTGTTDNTDTYAETLGPTGQTYLFNGEQVPFQPIPSEIRVLGGDPVPYVALRTVHGPVYAQDPANGLVFSWRYSFWDRELEMVEAFYTAWRSTSLADWQAVASDIPMSFNIFYADTEQNVAFWHVGAYPVRPGDPRLPASGDGSQEWLGFVDFADQPQAVNFAQPVLVNWNNKPAASWNQGDNMPWTDTTPSGYTRTFDGAESLEEHLNAAAASGAGITFEEVQELARVVEQNPQYPEYPATYQQVMAFGMGAVTRSESVLPPGQSGFISSTGVPSPHFSDQWPLYLSAGTAGPILMKDFTFSAPVEASVVPEAIVLPAGVRNRLDFEVLARNTTGEDQSVVASTFLTLPDGRVFGPLYGPRTYTLASGDRIGPGTIRQTIPRGAPEGVYTLAFRVQDADGGMIDTDGFDFRVGEAVVGKASRPEARAPQPAPAGWEAVLLDAPTSEPQQAALDLTLGSPFPNPSSDAVTVPFHLDAPGEVRLTVVDALGREVVVLASGTTEAGPHRAEIAAGTLAPGLYVVRLETADRTLVRRIAIAR